LGSITKVEKPSYEQLSLDVDLEGSSSDRLIYMSSWYSTSGNAKKV
jgi:hypothetical protein